MCYSAMVEQNAKKLGLRFKARVQTDLYDELFKRRLDGEKLYINKGMEEAFLNDAKSFEEKAIGKKIRGWHEAEIARLQDDLNTQKTRLEKALQVLGSGKPTKKAENDKRIATDKIEKFTRDIEKHSNLDKLSDSDFRIFPQHYVSMLTVDDKGEKIILPVRYHMRPANKDAAFDREYDGCYNARFDSIDRVQWWKTVLGKRHGMILVRRFFENVPTENYLKKNQLDPESRSKANIVLCFEPDNTEFMFIPMLWDVWSKTGEPTLYSGALITDEPAPEIAAAGHDRTPIFLKESAIDSWLSAKGATQEIKEILNQRERPHYSHRVLGVAS